MAGMTREEAINIIKSVRNNTLDYKLDKALEMAIKALEQEPMLDKIRAEIEQTPTVIWEENKNSYILASYFKKQVLKIIDKYRKGN